jgi:hypothetical protein
LALAEGRPFTWRAVVAAVRPRGSSSTFYEVAGPHARNALIDAYRQASDPDALQIAFNYRRGSAIERLIDEAKVWSFWECRELYRHWRYQVARARVDALVRAIAMWASDNPSLAAALHYGPPVCAVEDLVALHQGGLAPLRAQRWLNDVVREAVRRPGERCGGSPHGEVTADQGRDGGSLSVVAARARSTAWYSLADAGSMPRGTRGCQHR